jgi:hypothetical protein
MADARTQYIQERLEAGLEGWDPSPSVSSFLEQAKNKQVLADFYQGGAQNVNKLVFFCQPTEKNGKNKLSFLPGDNLTGKCVYFVCVNPKGVDQKTCETDIAYGEILGTPLGSLQTVLQEIFQPWTDHNDKLNKCSEGDWKEYVTAMGKFTNLVTEAVHSLDMSVELKMPDEKYKDIPPNQTGFAKAAVDRCACI